MDNSTLRVGNIPKVTGEDAIGVDNWALVVAEWADRLNATPEDYRLSEKAIDLDECGYDNFAALAELNARMLYKEFEFPMPVGKALVSVVKDIRRLQEGDGRRSDAAKPEETFSPGLVETPGDDEDDEEIVFFNKLAEGEKFGGDQCAEDQPEEKPSGGSLGGSAGDTTAYLGDKENGFIQSDTDKCLFYNPTTRLRAAVHVDDVFLRGSRYQTGIFWRKLEDKFPLKHWEIVEVGQPLIYTGIQIGKQLYDGVVHYTMSMEHDIRVFLEDVGMAQVREITAPRPCRQSWRYCQTTGESVSRNMWNTGLKWAPCHGSWDAGTT